MNEQRTRNRLLSHHSRSEKRRNVRLVFISLLDIEVPVELTSILAGSVPRRSTVASSVTLRVSQFVTDWRLSNTRVSTVVQLCTQMREVTFLTEGRSLVIGPPWATSELSVPLNKAFPTLNEASPQAQIFRLMRLCVCHLLCCPGHCGEYEGIYADN